jgi:hypothetical protein
LCTKLEITGEDSAYLVRQWFKRRHGPVASEKIRKPRRKVIRLMKNEKEGLRGQKQEFPTSPTSGNVMGNITFNSNNNSLMGLSVHPHSGPHLLGHHEESDGVAMQFGTLHHSALGQIGSQLPTIIHPMVSISGLPLTGSMNVGHHLPHGMSLNPQMDN